MSKDVSAREHNRKIDDSINTIKPILAKAYACYLAKDFEGYKAAGLDWLLKRYGIQIGDKVLLGRWKHDRVIILEDFEIVFDEIKPFNPDDEVLMTFTGECLPPYIPRSRPTEHLLGDTCVIRKTAI